MFFIDIEQNLLKSKMWRGFKVAILAMRLICMKDKLESMAIIHAFLGGNIEVFPLLLKKICIFCYIQLLLEWEHYRRKTCCIR